MSETRGNPLAFAERPRHELLATGETVRKRSVDTVDDLTPHRTALPYGRGLAAAPV